MLRYDKGTDVSLGLPVVDATRERNAAATTLRLASRWISRNWRKPSGIQASAHEFRLFL